MIDPEDIPVEELWNLDQTLAEYILPRLIAFRDKHRDGTFITVEPEGLDKMIRAFEIALADYGGEMPEAMEAWEAYHKSKGPAGTGGDDDLRDAWMDKLNAYHQEYREGMELFAENFWGLWD